MPTCANSRECSNAPAGRSKYCSAYCRERNKYLTIKEDGRYEARLARVREAYVHKPRLPRETPQCSQDECRRAAHGRGMCRMHYKRWARANGMERPPSDEWGDKRRSNHHARRARMNETSDGDTVLLQDIIDRDGTDCSLCGSPVDLSLTWPHKMYKTIEHTLPLARGGTHTMDNVTLAHFACNVAKGARVPA